MHMAKTCVRFCPLLLCRSSPRHVEFQYEERKVFPVFLVLEISSRHQLLPEDQIHHRLFSLFPQCYSLFTCTQSSTRQIELHDSRRTLHCKLHATLTLHYSQHYTLHYTQHYRNAAPGSISGQGTKNWRVFGFHCSKKNNIPKCCPCQQFGSVACSVACSVARGVACSVAWGCHATLVTFTSFLKKDFSSFPPSVAALPSSCCNMVKSKCTRLYALLFTD